MDSFRKFLFSLDAAERAAFAIRCGTTIGYLRNIMYGYRKASEALAIAIERESQGAVTVEELRPDLIEVWQYLRGTARQSVSAARIGAAA